jgi:hypothetical protein
MNGVLALLFFASWAGGLCCWGVGVVSLYRAAKLRMPGVPFFSAFSSVSALFRDALYTPEGLRHAHRHVLAMAAFLVFALCGFVTGRLAGY